MRCLDSASASWGGLFTSELSVQIELTNFSPIFLTSSPRRKVAGCLAASASSRSSMRARIGSQPLKHSIAADFAIGNSRP
jgi:hypothetical protein